MQHIAQLFLDITKLCKVYDTWHDLSCINLGVGGVTT